MQSMNGTALTRRSIAVPILTRGVIWGGLGAVAPPRKKKKRKKEQKKEKKKKKKKEKRNYE